MKFKTEANASLLHLMFFDNLKIFLFSYSQMLRRSITPSNFEVMLGKIVQRWLTNIAA